MSREHNGWFSVKKGSWRRGLWKKPKLFFEKWKGIRTWSRNRSKTMRRLSKLHDQVSSPKNIWLERKRFRNKKLEDFLE
jgi:hypothetical protein